MDRYLLSVLDAQSRNERQMLFLSGARQVGKTSLARALGERASAAYYLNWDVVEDRRLINLGPTAVAERCGLDQLRSERSYVAFDELHRYAHWRDFLKGMFDVYEERGRFLVTGSAALTTFRRGGDSLMGRYFPYTLHPLSVAELVGPQPEAPGTRSPRPIHDDAWDALWRFGGFPEPYLRGEQRFYNRWRRLRTEQLLREDLRDLARIREIDQVELLAHALAEQAGQLSNYTSLARLCGVSVDTIRRWLTTLESLYYCYRVPPWQNNVARSLRKQPKIFLWDWSLVQDEGARYENLLASALRKACDFWTDTGYGTYGLYFVRDKQGNEVDFCVTRDGKPWLLVEAKLALSAGLSAGLHRFAEQLGVTLALQVVRDAPYAEADAFAVTGPIKVPARTLLSQLV
ncbi:MAG: ATP-binding protein [Halieaceae bacterium]|jgi:predicted AAA+ superfamily ATPase|nr:ATP-binding protein [Halieaceae bacterium]